MLRPPSQRVCADERGFTLIETLVAIVAGLVIMAALFTILEVSVRQTSRLAGKVQATQMGRTTMTKIVDELRNGCISKEFTPVRSNSGESELRFVAGFGAEAVLTKAAEHRISFAGEKLTDKTYASVSGTWPNFTYSTTPEKTVQIGEYITQGESGGKKLPIFQYYEYAGSSSSSSSSAGVTTLNSTPLTVPLSESAAAKAASVLITFTASTPESKQTKAPSVELSNQVTFAFSAPSAETPIVAKPCE
jgi:prepilin-type N-terminal cleavage/methylation domain-containing protein